MAAKNKTWTKVYAPGSTKILVTLDGPVDQEGAVRVGKATLRDVIADANRALSADADEWVVVVNSTAPVENVKIDRDGGVTYAATDETDLNEVA